MQTLRIRLAVTVITALLLLAGCGNKSHPHTSNSKAKENKPAQSVSADYEQILTGVRTIVARQLGMEASAINIEAPLPKQNVTADELDVVEIIMNVEETFGVEIKDEEVSDAEGQLRDDLSVRMLADVVVRKKRDGK